MHVGCESNINCLITLLGTMTSLGNRVAGTIIALVSWFAFIVLYLAFLAGNLDFWQKVAVFLASGAIIGGIIAVIWVKWALK